MRRTGEPRELAEERDDDHVDGMIEIDLCIEVSRCK